MADQAKNAQNQAKSAAGAKDPKQQTYSEWAGQKYNQQYESWMPWIEDKYLSWFTKDNKTSYATKQQLDNTKVTNIEGVNKLQDGINETVGGQFGKGGLGQPIGDAVSKEGVNRAERGGKDDKGSYMGAVGGMFGGGKK